MASNRIKGITIEIGGDTTGLNKALSDVNKSIRDTQSDLKDVERLLKIDPSNVELLEQKQKLLTKAIADTQDKLKTLKEAEKQAQEQFKKGELSQEAYNKLKREIIETEQSEKNLQKSLKDTKSALDDQEGSMTKSVLTAEMMKDALVKVGEAVLKVAKEAVSYNAQMESFTASYASFLGSTEEAYKAIAAIKEDAASMPFGVSDLVEANRALITTGESAEDSRVAINALAEAVAATGGGNAELSRMATNLAQIKNTGKATSLDIKQFANAGINIYGLLSEYTGKSIEEVKDMEVSYQDLTAALQKATEEGGMYYGAMAEQAKTYNGQLNSLKSRIQDTLGTTFQSVSDTLRDEVFPAINQALDSIDFDSLGESISNIMELVAAILPVVSFVVTQAIDLIGKLIGNITPIIDDVKNLFNDLLDFISNVFAGNWEEAFSAIGRAVLSALATIADGLISVINSIVDVLNKVIEWVTGKSNVISKIPSIKTWSATPTPSTPLPSRGKPQALMAAGGVIANGSAIVGDNGPELLSMNGGVATVTPINNSTTNLGSINMNIYGAAGQNVSDLADIVMTRIQDAVSQKGAVWA